MSPEDAVKVAFMSGRCNPACTDIQVSNNNANSGGSSWAAGKISPEGAAMAATRGTPVDNSELQGSLSYAAQPYKGPPMLSKPLQVYPPLPSRAADIKIK